MPDQQPSRPPRHSVFDCNHWCSRHGGRANPATWDEPCCEDGPVGHTQQQHHDASPCYVPACPYCTHALTHHDQPDCWDCTNSGTVCDSEDA